MTASSQRPSMSPPSHPLSSITLFRLGSSPLQVPSAATMPKAHAQNAWQSELASKPTTLAIATVQHPVQLSAHPHSRMLFSSWTRRRYRTHSITNQHRTLLTRQRQNGSHPHPTSTSTAPSSLKTSHRRPRRHLPRLKASATTTTITTRTYLVQLCLQSLGENSPSHTQQMFGYSLRMSLEGWAPSSSPLSANT